MVRGPILPIYMSIISTIWLARLKVGVRSAESPTVPIADDASYMRFRNSASASKIDMAATATSQQVNVMTVMVIPDRTTKKTIKKKKHYVSRFPLKTDKTVNMSMAAVVVLIPPAVPAGDPPMNISIHPSRRELSVRPD